jgi:RNA polymerase sigma-70 factor (ECF subfamily)
MITIFAADKEFMNMSEAARDTSFKISREEDYEWIFRQYYQNLCNYAHTWLKDMDASEEVVQSVFVRLWEKKELLSIDTSIKSYLYKAVYHASLNEIRHRKIKEQYIHMQKEEEVSGPDINSGAKELEGKIEKALLTLPEQCRLIFRMSRFEELKYREIAAVLNISIKTVENQMGKALRLMRENLSDYLTIILVIIHFITNRS